MSLPVAFQLYSVRDEAAKDLYAALARVSEMGYDGVEFAGLYAHSPAEIKEVCERLSLVPLSAHVPYLDMMQDPEGVLSQYAELGCEYVVVPYLNEEYRPGKEKFLEVVENIKMLGAVAKRLGMKLLYHNHDFEFVDLDGKYALDMLYEEVSADLLETEIDTCWVSVAGVDPSEYVKKYSGRSPVVHLKDYYGEQSDDMYELIGIEKKASKPSAFEFRPLGDGLQNMPEILAAAESAGAKWVVVEQDNPSGGLTSFESAERSREYLKKIGY